MAEPIIFLKILFSFHGRLFNSGSGVGAVSHADVVVFGQETFVLVLLLKHFVCE